MKVEDLFNMDKEEINSYPFSYALITMLKCFAETDHFYEREELLESIEQFLINFSSAHIDSVIKMIMVGKVEFPLPNELSGWSEEEFDIIHKRYKKLKKMNKLSKEN